MIKLSLQNVCKSFPQKTDVIKSFSHDFYSGYYCIIGPSGVGKTTLLNLILGLIKPDSGNISNNFNDEIGVVFQEDRLCENITVEKNVTMVCRENRKEKAKILLKELGLEDCILSKTQTLSGGMKRRVAIARALVEEKKLYIFDEPFAGLDDPLKEQVIELIKRKTENSIVILVTHDKQDVLAFSANVINLK